jgi:hypothetical protein
MPPRERGARRTRVTESGGLEDTHLPSSPALFPVSENPMSEEKKKRWRNRATWIFAFAFGLFEDIRRIWREGQRS